MSMHPGNFLKIRTAIVLAVIGIFAAAIHPLTPRDFYQTMRSTLRDGAEARAENLIVESRKLQASRPGLNPAAAVAETANKLNVNLSEYIEGPRRADNSEVLADLRRRAASSIRLGLDLNGGVEFILNLRPDFAELATEGVSREEAEAKLQTNFRTYRDLAMESLRKRLEAQHIFESEITPFGSRALALRAPVVSADEKDKLRNLIQMSSKLEFRLVHPDSASMIAENSPSSIPVGFELLRENSSRKDTPEHASVVSRKVEMTGGNIEQAFVSRGEFGQIAIALRFNTRGAKEFAEVTARNVGRQLAIVLDGKLACAPVIRGEITGGQAEITGKFSFEEAQMVADALTSGSFPFRIDVEAVYDTDPTLGGDNVRNGILAGIIALVLLGGFMILYYHRAGVIAVLALTVNVVLILGAMAAFGATMTMPGIAGIILTLGMAVDANVLVFERMREEAEAGKSPRSIVSLGFSHAYSSVLDGNLTTLVVALILMYFGTGAVKGFAASLTIGILSSLFTALFMSRVMFDWLLARSGEQRFSMMKFFSRPNINFMKQSRPAIIVSTVLIAGSILLCASRGRDLLATDFTGGTLVSCSYQEQVPVDTLEKFLAASGIPAKVTYKRNAGISDNRKIEILLRDGAEKNLKIEKSLLAETLRKQLNQAFPQLRAENGLGTAVGGMVGGEMARNAVISIVLAFLGMIVYVSLRYEIVYAAAGIIALLHDVIVAMGIFALTGRELSLPVVAGILTIVGYSINDTIVIFDRIREESKLHPDRDFAETVNVSLNRTLSRTFLTSLTTFLVVAVMFLLGGIAINDFLLIIMLGIGIGTYSSLYIAAPLVVYYRNFVAVRHERSALICGKRV